MRKGRVLCALVVLVALVLGVVGCGETPKEKAAREVETAIAELEALMDSNTTEPTTAPEPAVSCNWGETTEIEGVTVIVFDPTFMPDLAATPWGVQIPGDLLTSEVYMVAVGLLNSGATTRHFTAYFLDVRNLEGVKLDEIEFDSGEVPEYEPLPDELDLAPGERVTGYICVQVSEDSAVKSVEYRDWAESAPRVVWEGW